MRPEGLPYSAEAWWQALLVFNYMTGWRISEPLALRREDLDLEAGTAITRHADNKVAGTNSYRFTRSSWSTSRPS